MQDFLLFMVNLNFGWYPLVIVYITMEKHHAFNG